MRDLVYIHWWSSMIPVEPGWPWCRMEWCGDRLKQMRRVWMRYSSSLSVAFDRCRSAKSGQEWRVHWKWWWQWIRVRLHWDKWQNSCWLSIARLFSMSHCSSVRWLNWDRNLDIVELQVEMTARRWQESMLLVVENRLKRKRRTLSTKNMFSIFDDRYIDWPSVCSMFWQWQLIVLWMVGVHKTTHRLIKSTNLLKTEYWLRQLWFHLRSRILYPSLIRNDRAMLMTTQCDFFLIKYERKGGRRKYRRIDWSIRAQLLLPYRGYTQWQDRLVSYGLRPFYLGAILVLYELG